MNFEEKERENCHKLYVFRAAVWYKAVMLLLNKFSDNAVQKMTQERSLVYELVIFLYTLKREGRVQRNIRNVL